MDFINGRFVYGLLVSGYIAWRVFSAVKTDSVFESIRDLLVAILWVLGWIVINTF